MKARRGIAAAAVAVSLFATSCSGGGGGGESTPTTTSESPTTSATTDNTADLPRERDNISYVENGGERQKLDLFLPEADKPGPYPVLVWIHGGRWREGDKSVFSSGDQGMDKFKAALLDRGYAVATMNYRLVPDSRFPDPLHDVSAAIRYVKSHAAELGVDPDRVAVGGESAGGHLATLEGLAASNPETPADFLGDLPVGGPGADSVDAKVDAVLGFYGQYDLRTRPEDRAQVPACGGGGRPGGPDSTEGQLLNADPTQGEGRELAGKASPVEYVSPSAPATMLLAGYKDCSAPYVQAERLDGMLKDAGVPHALKIIDAEHGAALFYDQEDTQKEVIDFLDANVKK
ncbi:MAG: alpha/beta hydrolase [Dermatophilus congolensis]|nr:alpha/beta hydrolase [Dermatophilus congolensis]